MRQENLEIKKAYIRQRILNGTFLPRPADIEELDNLEQKPLTQRKNVINHLYEHARRGVRHTELAFFMCDILGFENKILKQRNSLRLYDEIVLPLLDTGIREGKFASDFMEMIFATISKRLFNNEVQTRSKPPRVEALSFADTIILYPAISAKTQGVFSAPITQILLVNWAARYLFVEMLSREVLLRGSIGFGECLISRDPISYLGETIVEVHSAEILQNWGGVIFSPSAARIIREFNRPIYGVEKYRVPVKQDEKSKRLHRKLFPNSGGWNYVMDWTVLIELLGRNIHWVKRESENERLDPHARELHKNTVEFFNYMFHMRKHFSDLVK
jgi:hypothetical protein